MRASKRSIDGRVLLACWLLALPFAGMARINVVSLPGRDSVQLTIYNSADLTLVRETRFLTLRRGINRLEFSWANTLIDPTSVEFRALSRAEEVEVLDVSFPPRVTNTLEWRIKSEFAGEVQVEIRYFTSGITWAADYVVESTRDERAIDLRGWVRVTNRSGEDYENAQIRLVVGVVRLVEEIAQLARQGRPGSREEEARERKAKTQWNAQRRLAGVVLADALGVAESRLGEIVKEGLSEYFLYTVEGRDTIQTGWSKRLPSFRAEAVPITSYYKFEQERWADQAIRYYRFTNSVASRLGQEPLPDGAVQAFHVRSHEGLYGYVGRTAVRYIPIDESVDLELGTDQEVRVKPKLTEWVKKDITFDRDGNVQGWTIGESWQIEVQNSKRIPVVLDIRRSFDGDWDLATGAPYEKVDAHKVKFVLPLRPSERQRIEYQVQTRFGTNLTR